MTAKSTDYQVTGKIIPVGDGTRLRTSSSTYTTVLNSYGRNTPVEIDLVREFQETVMSEYHMAGDKWGRVVKVNGEAPKDTKGNPITGEAWMAIRYMGNPICSEDYDLVVVETPPVEDKRIIGMTVVLTYADNSQSAPIDMVVNDGQ